MQQFFCLKEDDFATLKAYNDYLEFAEDCIWEVINELDLEGVKQKIEDFKAENASRIAKSK